MTAAPRWVPVLILFAVLALAYLGMWHGWRKRGRRHDLPPLADASPPADPALRATGRYFGTTTSGNWLDRVVARELGTRSGCEVALSAEGLDVVRPSGSFRAPAAALRGARLDRGIAGKVVPPQGILVVTWEHGDLLLDSGFRFVDPARHQAWVDAVSRMVAATA